MNRHSSFTSRLCLAALTALTLWAGAGCGAETAFDCEQVCNRYKDCYDSSYDVGHCEDSCRTKAANDPTIKAKAAACESCIGDMSCISATFNCAQDCGAIVP
jgi:hypothetical protein